MVTRFVMTAAHCTEFVDSEELLVVVGEHDLSVHDDNGRSVAVRAIHEHPDYDDWSIGYDFAILELAENLNFSSHVRPACLPKVDADASYAGARGNFVVVGLPFNGSHPFYQV